MSDPNGPEDLLGALVESLVPPAELGSLAETLRLDVPVSRRFGPRAGEPIDLDGLDHPPGDHPPATTPTTPPSRKPRKPRKTRQPVAGEQLALEPAQLVSAPATAATGRIWSLALPWESVPWSLNDYWNRFKVATVKKDIRGTAMVLAQAAGIGHLGRARVCLHYLPMQSRVRDSENPVPTLKALCDGLVDAGVVDDDDTWRMVKEMPVIYNAVKGHRGRLWLVIEELEPCDNAPAPRVKAASAASS